MFSLSPADDTLGKYKPLLNFLIRIGERRSIELYKRIQEYLGTKDDVIYRRFSKI